MYINTNFLEQGATLCRYLQSKEAWRTVETLVIVTKDEEYGNGFIEDEEEQEEEAIANAAAAVPTKRGGKTLLHSPTNSNSNRGTSSSSRNHRSGTSNAALSPAGSDIGNSHNDSKTDIPSSPVASSSSSLPSKGSGGLSGGGTSMMDAGGGSTANATPVTVKHLFKIVYAFVAKATKLHTVIFDSLCELTAEEISHLSKALGNTKTKLRWLSFINCPHLGDAGMRYVG